MAEQGLFSANLISPEVASQLPESYSIRALRRSDYHTGFLDCLRVLTTVGEISEEKFNERYDWMNSQEGYYILVIEDSSSGKSVVVGTGALIVERKL
jgi:glucosamine-phosphate N-acetyltransferase